MQGSLFRNFRDSFFMRNPKSREFKVLDAGDGLSVISPEHSMTEQKRRLTPRVGRSETPEDDGK
ncbi:MAG: hypothetical protein DRH20_03290 [Deltaproteobacteria bacterium]|nr:MAG: hypothetical protein DRH20_03290 [Deltaproteobacteria bacterium]